MRAIITALSCALLFSAATLTFADYSNTGAETRLGMSLSRLYFLDDFWSIERLRPRVPAIGYSTAIQVLSPVLDRDSSSAYRWTDLAEAFTGAGDHVRAGYCYRRAGELAPHDPQILLAVGDFYFNQGDYRAAVGRFSAVLKLMEAPSGDPLTQNVFVYYERMGIRRQNLMDEAIPDAANARAWLRYLMAQASPAAAGDAWAWLRAHDFEDEPLTIDYTDYLYRKGKFDAAQEAWLSHFAGRRDGYSRLSPVFNGGFEYAFTRAVPDWRFDSIDGVQVRRDHALRFSGEYSLRIDFSGNDNPDFHHVRETVFVEPGAWRFEAHVRTEGITSDRGVGFRIAPLEGKPFAETETLTGTNDWKRLNATVEVPGGTRLLQIEVVRPRSIRIDNQLTGTAWIDDVKLTRIP